MSNAVPAVRSTILIVLLILYFSPYLYIYNLLLHLKGCIMHIFPVYTSFPQLAVQNDPY